MGRLDAAIGQYRRALDAGYRTYRVYASLAAAEAAKGNGIEAKLAIAEARRLNPQFTIKWSVEHFSGQHLGSILQEGRENANIDAGWRFIWRISGNIIQAGRRAIPDDCLAFGVAHSNLADSGPVPRGFLGR
jgi:hypothetical protein